MENIKFLYAKNWDYCLYEIDRKKIITVAFFASFADYERSFYLNDNELNMNYDELSILAEEIRFNYEQYKDREIIPPIVD
jgi:hypothetical protein